MTENRADSAADRIFIRDLLIRCIIGIEAHEREEKQDILVHITLDADLRRAGRTDAIEDTVDYKVLKKQILRMAENSRFCLIETMAQRIADECLKDDRVRRVHVVVEKPGALRFARTVGVEITRSRNGSGEPNA